MLERPPSRQERRRSRQARHRARQRAGIAIYPVPLDGDALELLIKWHWLDEADAGDKQLVGAAIGARLAELVDYMTRR